MKIRTVALGLNLCAADLLEDQLRTKLLQAKAHLDAVSDALTAAHEIQTQRVVFNSWEEWLLPLLRAPHNLQLEAVLAKLHACLEEVSIHFCSIGCCHSPEAIALIPAILATSTRISTSVHFPKEALIAPSPELCLAAARACLGVAKTSGDLGNFRFCVSFNCPPGIPFFPAAYHSSSGGTDTGAGAGASVGEGESGELITLLTKRRR
mmetsp:Transcript_2461/g.5738  ORF Transcript_2461/g.5738 Transcript_2461/m.5738 type:complete len:208 (-) Transcript_2461:271-894(-)